MLLKSLQDFNKTKGAYCSRSLALTYVSATKSKNLKAYCSLVCIRKTTSLVLSLKKKTITKSKNVNSIFFVKNTGFERESTTSWSVVYACAVLLAFPKVSRRFAALCAISLLLKSLILKSSMLLVSLILAGF